MTCLECTAGFVPFVDTANTKPDAEIGVDDLFFAVCLCPLGQVWRNRRNEQSNVPPLWLVWCSQQGISADRVYMVEDVYSAAELEAAGLRRKPASISREAALLGKGKR